MSRPPVDKKFLRGLAIGLAVSAAWLLLVWLLWF
jgi:hypothetical protein